MTGQQSPHRRSGRSQATATLAVRGGAVQVVYPLSVDTDQSAAKVGHVDKRRVNTAGQVLKRRICRTYDNAGVFWIDGVQADEVATVEGDHRTIGADGKCQDILIRHCLTSPAAVGGGHDIMPKTPQRPHGIKREILVGIQARQGSRSLVRIDLGSYFHLVRPSVGPGVGEILSMQHGVVAQQIGF